MAKCTNNLEKLIEMESEEETFPQRLASSRRGMVATAHWMATAAGTDVLEDGGNAVDAAVAAAFALGVCEPMASGLGGQTMMLLHAGGKNIAVDGSSRAPNRATPGLLRSREMRLGHRATTVPSTPAVLEYVRRKHGTMPLARLLEPAVRIAESGYRISELQHFLAKRALDNLCECSGGNIFLKELDAHPVGSIFKQPALAGTMRQLSEKGIEDFYTGEIAHGIHEDMVANDGLVHLDDLARIPWPIERRPVAGRFRESRLLTFPPPGAGRVLIEMVNILSHFSAEKWDIDTPQGAVLLAEVIRQAQLDRQDRPFDPHMYTQAEEKRNTDTGYAGRIARRLHRRLKTGGETSHLSVMDGEGNTVALTQSIERAFGACAANPQLGFLYNNYMSAFEYEDISHPYYLRPNAVPWASVAPTIVFHGRHPWAALGSAGSERIAPAVMEVLLRLEKMPPLEAVSAPRLYCSTDRTVHVEASRMDTRVLQALSGAGFKLHEREPFAFFMGCVQLVLRDRKGFTGVADVRRDGAAGGPAK